MGRTGYRLRLNDLYTFVIFRSLLEWTGRSRIGDFRRLSRLGIILSTPYVLFCENLRFQFFIRCVVSTALVDDLVLV